MIDHDIRRLETGAVDRSLERLEADVWARLEEHERARRRGARLLVIEGFLIALAFGVSAGAGCYCGYRAHRAVELSIFLPRAPLTARTLLDRDGP